MTETYALAKKLAYDLLASLSPGRTEPDEIAKRVEAACDLVEGQAGVTIEPAQRLRLKKEIETDFAQLVGRPRVLQDKDHTEWLDAREPDMTWPFWSRYRDYVEGRIPPSSVDALEDSTRLVLGLLEDPTREGSWDRRGLVVGQVQSGKTGHYTGLINRACDAGYKLVVVLAGMHNNLRSQTQVRLDEGFLGWESGAEEGRPTVGVGKNRKFLPADTITTRQDNGDFKKSKAESFRVSIGKVPLLFVVKKNVSVLNNMVKWVRSLPTEVDPETGRVYVPDIPILVIDDEADHASVDTKKGPVDAYGNPDPEHDPARTNSLIRQLLFTFDKSCYIGYTATPFANIFIHDKGETKLEGPDLFPRSFIIGLEAPDNYVGPAKVFGLYPDDGSAFDEVKPLPLTRRNDEGEKWVPPKHKPAHTPRFNEDSATPPSLERAVLAFVLAGAARTARGQGNEHHSMLVHVTRFVEVQRQVRTQLKTYLNQVRRLLSRGSGGASNIVLVQLRELWETDFVPTTAAVIEGLDYHDAQISPLAWEEIEPHILPLLNSIQVYEVNGSATDALEYEKFKDRGLKVIAVGGDKLSRGLTLEGLTVSYFLRTSRMYDTLMQMGRWFGYRPGYVDLCRLYLPEPLEDAFVHITEANEELHREFAVMEGIKATPEDYGLKVLRHPTLLVTSPSKMRSGELQRLSFGGTISQTVVFYADSSTTRGNLQAVEDLVAQLGEPRPRRTTADGRPLPVADNVIWDGVTAGQVMEFLGSYRTHADASKIQSSRLVDYIRRQLGADELCDWTVALISNTAGKPVEVAGHVVGLTVRETGGGRFGDSLAIRALLSPGDESIGMSTDEIERAKQIAAKRRSLPLADVQPGGIDLRNARDPRHGLLIVYSLDPTRVGHSVDHVEGHPDRTDDPSHPLMGFAISFPASKRTPARDYVVNPVQRRKDAEDE